MTGYDSAFLDTRPVQGRSPEISGDEIRDTYETQGTHLVSYTDYPLLDHSVTVTMPPSGCR